MSSYLPQPFEPLPQTGDFSNIEHLIEVITETDEATLQSSVNTFLSDLEDPLLPTPYIRDIQYLFYEASGGGNPKTRFVALIHYTTYGP